MTRWMRSQIAHGSVQSARLPENRALETLIRVEDFQELERYVGSWWAGVRPAPWVALRPGAFEEARCD